MGGYIGGRSVVLSTTAANVQDVTATDTTPEVTIINNTHEDTDGGREGKVIFKGQQSGGEESTLAEIQGSHDGTADDEKGDLIFKTNDGSDGSSPTERMRIDSAGNVTVSNAIVLDNKDTTLSGGEVLGKIEFQDNDGGSAAAGITSKIESLAVGDFGASALTLSTSGSSGGARTALTERMRIDNSGNVGIGENSPDTNFHIDATSSGNFTEAMRVSNTGGGANEGNYIQWEIANTSGYGPRIGGRREGTGGTGLHFYTGEINGAPTERMRIDHDGNVGLGTASPSYRFVASAGGMAAVSQFGRSTDGTLRTLMLFRSESEGAFVGSLQVNNSSTAYNTSSDYRLKENVETLSGGIDRVKQLKPKRFSWIVEKEDSANVDGFLAHEAATVVPESVSGEKDATTEEVLYVDGDEIPEGKKVGDVKTASTIDPQGIDHSKLVPLLTAALQEAIAKIETLETKVAALEAG